MSLEHITTENLEKCFYARLEKGEETVAEITTSLLQYIDALEDEENISKKSAQELIDSLTTLAKDNNLYIKHTK
jgi:hypothetical protein